LEIKKLHSAELEHESRTGFMLGIIFCLSTLFVCLEYNANPRFGASDDDALLDELAEEMELMPDMPMPMLIPEIAKPELPTVMEEVRAVDDADETPETPPEVVTPEIIEEKPLTDDANVEEILPQVPIAEDEPIHFRVVEQIPEFPGGMGAFVRWLSKNIKYPPQAQKQKIKGRTIVSFIVNKDGSVSDVKIEKSANTMLDSEVLRVMRTMPRWKAGVQNDQPCRTMVAVPIVFSL